jgi:uncharacterized membrane protein
MIADYFFPIALVMAALGVLALLLYFGAKLARGLVRRHRMRDLRIDQDSFFTVLGLLAIIIATIFATYYLFILTFLFGGMHR